MLSDDYVISKDQTPVTHSAPPNVFFAEFGEKRPKAPAGALDIDDLIAEFEQDSGAAAAIQAGRQWVADEFYKDEPTSIRALRLKKGLSQAQLASAIGTSQSHVARIERGTEDLRASTIARLAAPLGLQPEELFKLIISNKIQQEAGV